jgi:hypothetical protein
VQVIVCVIGDVVKRKHFLGLKKTTGDTEVSKVFKSWREIKKKSTRAGCLSVFWLSGGKRSVLVAFCFHIHRVLLLCKLFTYTNA